MKKLATQQRMTVGRYLVQRLEEAGLGHVFGVPGDYVLKFYDRLVESRIKVIGTCTELGAGFAADAYARINGLGAACVTYCVGGFNALNAVAGAYAEKSPLILISGAPGLHERTRAAMLHHRVRGFDTQLEIYDKVTVAAVALEDAKAAPGLIDRAIRACQEHKRPVYIEIPRDMVDRPCAEPTQLRREIKRSDPKTLTEAIAEAAAMLRTAKRPVILGGIEIHRLGLQRELVQFVERTGYPIAATLLSKSVISERHPQYLGIYEGAVGLASVRKAVEGADCLLMLGAFLTDIDLGGHNPRIHPSRSIDAMSDRTTIRHHHYDDIQLKDFIEALMNAPIGRRRVCRIRHPVPRPFIAKTGQAMTVRRFFVRMNEFIDKGTVVIADVGDSLFGASDLTIHRSTEFLGPAYYASMGFAVPAAIGAQIKHRHLRPLVFVGDGAFQMTGQELSTAAKYGLTPIVFVLNNKGYTTERYIHDGPYNDIHDWAYHLLPQLLRDGWGAEVRTEDELEQALIRARGNTTGFSIINVHFDPMDRSEALERLGHTLGLAVANSAGKRRVKK